MSDFSEARVEAHPNKTNTLTLGIIMLLIGILSIQIWLLYSALNNALDENQDLALASFIGSLVLFFVGLWLLKFLPAADVVHNKLELPEKDVNKYKGDRYK
ncbi:hypothetical protein CLV24_1502 [Pontibacter ummariensis]|uniref:Uncharacterized protein n=1 Tax=Pontibacter ummariensis TaxID=1610492 RepID=A0A239LSH4_9BACT|nr:DUF6755 family protein [Pontibacter ummariensis]PRY01208.1 hypothetical protein CLV24_1502 [Pontibacter ummariensis]SNT33476.1 hypothetical protein SAMN06296052_1502 [Pontibacter ummariensis]